MSKRKMVPEWKDIRAEGKTVYISVKTLKADNDVYSMMDAVLQKDYNIQVETGELKGRMREDRLLSNRINVYDKYGNKRDFLAKDILSEDTLFLQQVSAMDTRAIRSLSFGRIFVDKSKR